MNAHRVSRLVLVGAAASFLAAPMAHAANRTVQIDGRLVAPAQVSEAQLAAGHGPSTRLVQFDGRLISPSQLSAAQSSATLPAYPVEAAGGSSSDFSTGEVALTAVLASVMVLLGASALMMRRRLATPA